MSGLVLQLKEENKLITAVEKRKEVLTKKKTSVRKVRRSKERGSGLLTTIKKGKREKLSPQ